MDKKLIISELLKILSADLELAIIAAERTKKLKSEDDMKPEHKYDTRGIEAGYLSDGQKKRIVELEFSLKCLKKMKLRDFKTNDEIALGALIEIDMQGQKKIYFLSPSGGGNQLREQEKIIYVITPSSPVGSALIGLKSGDSFEVETQKGLRECVITRVL